MTTFRKLPNGKIIVASTNTFGMSPREAAEHLKQCQAEQPKPKFVEVSPGVFGLADDVVCVDVGGQTLMTRKSAWKL